MFEVQGDIWDYHDKGFWVVVPTNTRYSLGKAHMGKGVAEQAAKRFLPLRERYALSIADGEEFTAYEDWRMIMLPTKLDWRNPARLSLIEEGLHKLYHWWEGFSTMEAPAFVALPRIGTGLGRLDWETQVKPLVETILVGDQWVIVQKQGHIRKHSHARVL